MSALLSTTLIALVLHAALAAAPALAIETHPFTGVTIGPKGKSAAGTFGYLQSVTVDPSSGDLYVLATAGEGRLYKFDDEGEPLDFVGTGTNFLAGVGGVATPTQNQIAIAPPGSSGGTAGDIYLTVGNELKIYSAAGLKIGGIQEETFTGQFCGVATDEAGSVFTKSASFSDPIVRKYSPVGNPVTAADESGHSIAPLQRETCNLAIDGNGHVFVAGNKLGSNIEGGEEGAGLFRLESLSASTVESVDSLAHTVAVEPATNNIYSGHSSEIVQYEEDLSLVSKFGEGKIKEAVGVSIDGPGGLVYVSDRNRADEPNLFDGRVDVYGPLRNLPNALAGAADTIGKTSAVLHGTINADGGPEATCKFEFTTESAFEAERFEGASSAPCVSAGPFTGETAEPVSAEISSLETGVKYRFRLVGSSENGSLASDENGSTPGQVPSFETLPAINVHTGSTSNLTPTSVTLSGSMNPEGVEVGECFFEYGTTTAYGYVTPCEDPGAGEIGTGDEPVAVHADIKGLTESTGYHFRLNGTTSFGVTHGADVFFSTVGHPQILTQSFSEVDQTAVTVSGSINPEGEPTTYVVEYVTQISFEESEFATATEVPVGGAPIGSSYSGVSVSQRLSGLLPGTSYVFRLSAINDAGFGAGPAEGFRTQVTSPLFGSCPENDSFRAGPSALLPDCRAYEQASSPEKNGGSVAGIYSLLFASEDGSAVTYYSPAGTLPPAVGGGTQNYSTYQASRDGAAGAWSSQRLLPPEEFGESAEYLGSTPDLRYAVAEAGSGSQIGLFVIDTEDGTVTTVVPYVTKADQKINQFGFDGASADGSRIFFESRIALQTIPADPAPVPGHINLYMWDRTSDNVSLIGVLPSDEGGEAPAAGSFGGAYEWYEEENPSHGGALNNVGGNSSEPIGVASVHALTPSGEQIFFTAAETGQLYLRRGLGGPSPTTVHISTPNAGVTGTPGGLPGAFQEATPDGSRAFFISREKLTTDARTGPEEEGMDLYRWDASAPPSEALTDIAPDVGDANGAEVQGLLGVSPSGSTGYFVARGVLAAHAKKGGENLYRFSEKTGGGFRIAFIATLAEGGAQSPDRRNVSPKTSFAYPVGKTSRLSKDGTTLLFASRESLTDYDNVNPEGISCEAGHCPELYLFSSQTEIVSCVSCNPTGETPTGAASLQDQFFNAYFTPTEPPVINPSRNLSADGARVFFQTPDPLAAADTNGDAGCHSSGGSAGSRGGTGRCQDVYEWEAAGSGSCTTAEVNGGCLYLLSTGKSDTPSFFVSASKDGSSAFIATTSQLVPSDRDQADDVYDVRVGGGLAAQHATPMVPCGSPEACNGPGSAPGPVTAPGTTSFQGPGNPKPNRCRKGFVRKHGKCVKKHEHRKKRSKPHDKKRSTGEKHSRGAK